MPNILEIQVQQKQLLFDLLTLEKNNVGTKVKGLGKLINKAKSGMSNEDVAYVVQLVDKDDET